MGYDESNHSILVSFASDTTEHSDPSMYPSLAFQPLNMWPDVEDVNELKKRIATAGLYQAQLQETQEKITLDTTRIETFKNMVGEEYEYVISELSSDFYETPFQKV